MFAFLSRWWQFLKERFEPIGSSVTILAFFAANAVMAYPVQQPFGFGSARAFAGFVLIWLIFFHMRLFDEVKDYSFDKEHNPERPLARGLIDLLEFGVITLIVILTETAIAANLGWQVLVSYSFVLAFTLLMRMEFFVGEWLKPRLELYAISHTFSASLMGILIFSIVTSMYPVQAENFFIFFALANWFVFNVFEFGRKTFGREEERCKDDSYSTRLGPTGAVILLLSNLLAGFALLRHSCVLKYGEAHSNILVPTGICSILVILAGLYYILDPSQKRGKIYRGTVAFFLLAYHVAIFFGAYSMV